MMTTLRKRGKALLLAFAMFVLTACGATVDTALNLNETATSGSRVMTLTIDDTSKSAEYIKGGMSAVDASITSHLPAELEYSGITEDGKKAVATFTLNFSSIDDYEQKVKSLLTASGVNQTPSITISHHEQGLVTGTTVDENFSSSDLLGWVADSLVADGVVDKSNKSSIFSSGEYSIKLGEKVVKDKGSGSISFKDVTDNGVNRIYVLASIKDDGKIEGNVILGDSSTMGSVKEQKIDEYITALGLGDNITVSEQNGSIGETSSQAYGKKLSFTAANFEEFSTNLQKILGSERNSIQVSEENSSKSSPSVVSTIKGNLECTAVCSPDGYDPVFILQAPSSWSWVNGSNASQSYGSDNDISAYSSDTAFTMQFEYSIPLKSASVETNRSLGGSIEQVWEFKADSKAVETTAGGFEKYLAPEEGKGSIETSEADGVTTYKVTISGKNAEEFSANLSSYIPGAYYQEERGSGFSLWPNYNVHLYLPVTESKLAGGTTDGYTYKLNLPALNSFDGSSKSTVAEGVTVSGGTISAEQTSMSGYDLTSNIYVAAKGPTIGSLVALAVLLILLLLAIILIIIFRKKIAEKSKKAWDNRDRVVAATSAGVGAATAAARSASEQVRATAQTANEQVVSYAAMPAEQDPNAFAQGDRATWQQEFTENKMQ